MISGLFCRLVPVPTSGSPTPFFGLDTVEVTGSSPVSPTHFFPANRHVSGHRGRFQGRFIGVVFCTVDERPDDLTLVRLVLARQRRQGASFEQAWRLSLSALDRPTKGKLDVDALDATRHALEATRDAWLAAVATRRPAGAPAWPPGDS
jgi:hypothetical protein